MKTPDDDDLEIWAKITGDVRRLEKNIHTEPLRYKKERPKPNPDYFYPEAVQKHTYRVETLNYHDIKKQKIQGTIDLHGDTLANALWRLESFLISAQRKHYKMVLVITGKGRTENGENIGVLRQEIPKWMRENSQFVIGFGSAQPHHGGDGAFYVRVRKLPSF